MLNKTAWIFVAMFFISGCVDPVTLTVLFGAAAATSTMGKNAYDFYREKAEGTTEVLRCVKQPDESLICKPERKSITQDKE